VREWLSRKHDLARIRRRFASGDQKTFGVKHHVDEIVRELIPGLERRTFDGPDGILQHGGNGNCSLDHSENLAKQPRVFTSPVEECLDDRVRPVDAVTYCTF
jgi:hypothetical protein